MRVRGTGSHRVRGTCPESERYGTCSESEGVGVQTVIGGCRQRVRGGCPWSSSPGAPDARAAEAFAPSRGSPERSGLVYIDSSK